MASSPFALLKVLAKVLGNALGAGIAGDLLIEVLPEMAKDGWEWWSKEKDEKERRKELQAIVQSGNTQLSEQIREIVRSEIANQPQVVQQTVQLYLQQLPDSIRSQMRRLEDPSGATVPPNLVLHKAEDLLRLLPAKLAHFKPGDRPLAGVDWELEQLLGVGGFGEVWKAHNPHVQSVAPVALKFCLDPLAARSLRNEASLLDRVMRQGRHPGIVQLLRTYLSASTPCLEYEFVEGGDLGGLILEWQRQHKGPTLPEAGRVILRLAEIVAVAHSAQPPIVHRDLKPSNILIVSEGKETRFKITDFGIGGVTMEQLRRGSLSHSLPSALQGSYTPLYASPQQMQGQAPDTRDDIYALGVIWYQLLSGDLNSGRPGGTRWIERLVVGGAEQPLIELLAACFEDEKDDRPADAVALAARLTQALKPTPTLVTTTTVPPTLVKVGLWQHWFGGKRTESSAVPSPARQYELKPAAAPEPAGSPVARAPTIGSSAPAFQFRNGKEAQTLQELVQVCVADPPAAIWHLNSGHFEIWFKTQGLEELAKQSSQIRQQEAPNDKRLLRFLDATGIRHGYRAGPLGDFDWVLIPASEFLMGSDPQQDAASQADQRPQHSVYVDAFHIARVPVTNAQWKLFVDNTVRAAPEHWSNGRIPNGKEKHPVVNVSWQEAQEFCKWAGVRLPTEAEWEKAARGVDGRIYPWGYTPPNANLCNFDNNVKDITPVGNYPKGASPYGVLDMAGNVWEWCADWYDENYYQKSPASNPKGPPNGQYRVVRGGAFFFI